MSRLEMRRWLEFYELNPFDDDSRFNRPAALIAGVTRGRDPQIALRWLRREAQLDEHDAKQATETEPGGFSAADLRTMAALGVKPPKRKG